MLVSLIFSFYGWVGGVVMTTILGHKLFPRNLSNSLTQSTSQKLLHNTLLLFCLLNNFAPILRAVCILTLRTQNKFFLLLNVCYNPSFETLLSSLLNIIYVCLYTFGLFVSETKKCARTYMQHSSIVQHRTINSRLICFGD